MSKIALYYPKNVCLSAFVSSKSLKRRSWVKRGGGVMGYPVYCCVSMNKISEQRPPVLNSEKGESLSSQGNFRVKHKVNKSYNHSPRGFIKNNVLSSSLYFTLECLLNI